MATTFAVPDGRVAMAATLYTGTGTISQAVSNAVNTVSFQPDLVWVKARNASAANSLYDSIRGTKKFLASNTLDAEIDFSPFGVTAFGSSGFTVGDISSGFYYCNGASGGAQSGTPPNYVGWQWKAGGTAVSNTAGTITSSVSANTTAGFSVVTYTGNGTAGGSVGHGLGVTPGFIIFKSRDATQEWRVWLTSFGTGNALALNSTQGTATNSAVMNAAPSSTVFTMLGTGYSINGSGVAYVAYCWAPVAGYSAFGSYTGNGSADGPFIYTGFRPRWIMVKSSTNGIQQWYMWDSSRDTYNPESNTLYPNLSNAEATSVLGDFVSNGVKIRQTLAGVNESGGTYIYAAFAENPLKYANAR